LEGKIASHDQYGGRPLLRHMLLRPIKIGTTSVRLKCGEDKE
jgi:hypothetical protein